jgi:hypothetical protein
VIVAESAVPEPTRIATAGAVISVVVSVADERFVKLMLAVPALRPTRSKYA